MSNLNGAEHMRIEKRQEPGHREALPDANQMAVRSYAAREWQRGKEILHARHRRQLELEGRSRAGGERLEKRVRQRASKPGRDRGRKCGTVHTEAECDSLVDRRR